MATIDVRSLGEYIREQRESAEVSLRQLAKNAGVSNPYLSQVERGLHQPSVRVLRSIAAALGVPADELLAHAGLTTRSVPAKPSPADTRSSDSNASDAEGKARPESSTAAAILADQALSDDQRQALLAVYRSFLPRT